MSDYVYVNVSAISPINSAPVQATFQEFRSLPIVDDSSKYKLSVIRWQSFGLLLPAFIPLIDVSQNDPNVTVYKVGLTGGATSATANVIWAPQNANATAPLSTAGVDFQTSYYSSSDVTWFLGRINAALVTCYNVIKAAQPSLTAAVPFFVYSNGYFQLYAPTIGFGSTATEAWSLSINSALKTLLNFFPCSSTNNGANSDFNTLAIAPACPSTGGSPNYYVQQQQARSDDSWSPISSLVFVTNSAVVTEECSPPNLLGQGSNPSISRNFQPQLTDFTLPLTGGTYDYSGGNIDYSPSAEFRWSNLLASADLKSLNFQVFWQCKFNGSQYPVFFVAGGAGSLTMKLLLQRLAPGV